MVQLTEKEIQLLKRALKEAQCRISEKQLVTSWEDSKTITEMQKLLIKLN